MDLNSYEFILYFLPFVLVGYYILTSKGKYSLSNLFLLFASFVFYLFFDWKCFLFLLILSLINYYIGRYIFRHKVKIVLSSGILINVITLCVFKYYNFFSDALFIVCKEDSLFENIVMPLGISFFIFQQIAYLTDSYRNDGVTEHTVIEHLLFSFFFPSISCGPITYFSEMIPQFRDETKKIINYENICKGLLLFSLGLGKKVLLAQPFADAVSTGYDGLIDLNYQVINTLLLTVCYTFQIYFDFSGYSDMAIGVAKMFNIDLPVNFNSPYQAYNITDFWSRWHITLTRFLTKYIYIPLGGNRKGTIRTYINIMIVFIISGLWHGAAFTFLIWGIIHGVLSLMYRIGKKIYDKWHPAVQWIITILSVNFAWIYFGAKTKELANTVVSKLLSFKFENVDIFLADCFNITEADLVFESLSGRKLPDVYPNTMMIIFLFVSFFIIMCTQNNMRIVKEGFVYKKRHAVITAVVLMASLVSLSSISTFVYATF